MVDIRHSLAAIAVTIVSALFVIGRAATAPAPTPKRAAAPADRVIIATQISQSEKNWLREVGENFPDDNWSQRDDFHGKEYRKIEELSAKDGVRIEDTLKIIDDDIHTAKAANAAAPDTRAAHAVPCKPRPFYD
jgi:hypothetical protein